MSYFIILQVFKNLPHGIYSRGTQREYSSKPLKHSIVKRTLGILEFKR